MSFTTGRKLPFARSNTINITPDPKPKRQKVDVTIKRHGQKLGYSRLKTIRAANGGKAKRGDIDIVVTEFSQTIYSKIVTKRMLRYRSGREAKGLPAFDDNDYDSDETSNDENDNVGEELTNNNNENDDNIDHDSNVNNISIGTKIIFQIPPK